MKPIVFLGPSCPRHVAAGVGDIELRPPATRGDLVAASDAGGQTIVLIDGEMVHGYAPSPSEILCILQRGVRVLGAASLGALRAVELRAHGMEGLGWVHDAYLNGRLAGDDEVVSLLFPETFSPLTIPLVRLRYAVERLAVVGELDAAAGGAALRELKSLHYEDRSPQRVESALVRAGIGPTLRSRLSSSEFDIKCIDALACIRAATAHRLAHA